MKIFFVFKPYSFEQQKAYWFESDFYVSWDFIDRYIIDNRQ